MKVEYNQELFKTNLSWFESSSGWLLKFGDVYRFDNIYSDAKYHASCIRRAIDNGSMNTTAISTRYHAQSKTIYYYPHGTFKCTACCSSAQRVTMSAYEPIYFAPCEDEDGNYSVMICHKCHKDIKETNQRVLSHSFTEFCFRNSDTTDKLRKQALDRAIVNKERRALFVIRPNMVHWGFKYQGPCYSIINKRYT